MEEGTSPEAYWRGATWKRVAVIAAGPFANIVVAFLILFLVFAVSGGPSNRPSADVAAVTSGTPAAAAGLQPGDRIVAVNGHPLARLRHRVSARSGRATVGQITLTVLRDGRRVDRRPASHDQGRRTLGLRLPGRSTDRPVLDRQSRPHCGVGPLGHRDGDTGRGLGGLFSSHGRSQLSGPVGIVEVSQQQLQVGLRYYLEILAFVSMSLALLNLLPLLPLDGGHILFSLIEAVRRRALAREVYERVSVVGIRPRPARCSSSRPRTTSPARCTERASASSEGAIRRESAWLD